MFQFFGPDCSFILNMFKGNFLNFMNGRIRKHLVNDRCEKIDCFAIGQIKTLLHGRSVALLLDCHGNLGDCWRSGRGSVCSRGNIGSMGRIRVRLDIGRRHGSMRIVGVSMRTRRRRCG